MKFYIRKKPCWITFIHDVSELRSLIADYMPGNRLVIGDLSQFNNSMMNMMLKFCEDNPSIDVYSSTDLNNRVLMSRFSEVIKEPLKLDPMYSVEAFQESDKSSQSVLMYLNPYANSKKILAIKCNPQIFKILQRI